MFFNKLTCPLIFAVLLVAGVAFVAPSATAAELVVLSVTDEDTTTQNPIEVYGIRAESVSFQLTITFQDDNNPPVNTPVDGFDATDIKLFAADSSDIPVPSGATASPVLSKGGDISVYTTTITAKGNVSQVFIQVPADAATILLPFQGGVPQFGNSTPTRDTGLSVKIVRSAADPLTLSPDRLIGGNAPFTVTLTSSTPITLTEADLKVIGGSIDSLTPDAARRVWTVTIRPGVGITQITVEPSATGSFIFPKDERSKGTFTVDTTGPVAEIAPGPIVNSITITFNEPLQTGATLLDSEIAVIGASIDVLSPILGMNSYIVTLIPDSGGATTVTVQVKAGAVADAGGVPNEPTPSPAYTFRVAATAPTTPGATPRQGGVTISEIMFATDGGANEIQWIELSNNSKTQAVALDVGSGWELIIENYNDRRAGRDPLSGTINFKNSGRVKTIPPEQAVLIVSASGRSSATTHAKGQLFAATRVFKVFPALADEFGMRTARDPFLHPTEGFHIQLVDGRSNVVDEVGNLDGRIRTVDEPAWELPNGWTANGDRTSIIRRHRRGIADDGTQATGWIAAAETSFLYLLEKRLDTWYGLRTDQGSPGVRAGRALPVQLSQFRPDLTETGAVVINWTTESEMDNAGFNILRSETRTGEFKVINAQLIPGAGTTAERRTYTWTDTTAKPNVVYYYQIEDVSLDGERQALATVRLRGFVSATGKLTTQWGQLKRSRD